MEEDIISLQEVSEKLGITYQGVSKWMKKLSLSKVKKGRKNFLTQADFAKIQAARSHNTRNFVAPVKVETSDLLEPAIRILADTIDALKTELNTKNEQIAKLNQTVDQLIERDRETNILIKSFQDKFFQEWLTSDKQLPATEVRTHSSLEEGESTSEENTNIVNAEIIEEPPIVSVADTPERAEETQTVPKIEFTRENILAWLKDLEKEELKSIWTEMTLLLRK